MNFLYHFDMPMVLQEKVVGKAVKWLICMLTLPKPVLNCLASREKWFTHNEPIVPVEGGYLYGWHYPDKVNLKEGIQVLIMKL